MQLQTVNTQNSKIGICPHGLPQGACPICSGMAGGAKKADFSAKPGEMSWNECAAIGAFLRAQKAAKQAHEADYQARVANMAKFQVIMSNAAARSAQFAQIIQNSMPSLIAKPVAFLANSLAKSLNMIKDFPVAVVNFVQKISQKYADITDKLTAVYGEMKAAVSKKISDIVSEVKKKIKCLFEIFETLNADDEDRKIDEAKRTFELKTFIHKLYRKIKNNGKN